MSLLKPRDANSNILADYFTCQITGFHQIFFTPGLGYNIYQLELGKKNGSAQVESSM